MTDQSSEYYQSHGKLNFIGPNGQLKLGQAKVLVIGAGGLGCPCLLALAGCGIGIIGIADFDTITVSNLHRQVLYHFDDVGQPKTGIAKQRLLQHNPYITINGHRLLVNESNVLDLIKSYDVIIDGTDNFAVRYLINDACVYLDKLLVYGAIYQTEGQLTVFNYQDSGTLRCVFPEPDAEIYVPSCAEIGAYNIITNVIGVMMANEAVKVILQNKQMLINKLLTYDALSAKMRTISYKPDLQSRVKSISRFTEKSTAIDISPEEFFALVPDSYHLIDVREEWERDEHHIGGEHIPLNALSKHDFSALLKNHQLIFYCEQGTRSIAAAQILRKMGYTNAVSLRGGLKDLKQS